MSRKPRVVAVHPNSEMYGSDRMFLASVAALQEKAEVVAVLPQEGPLLEAIRALGVKATVSSFPVLRKVSLRGLRVVSFVGATLVTLPRLVLHLRRLRAGTVYVSTVISPIWMLAGRLAGCAVVCHVHENEPTMSPLKRRVLLSPLLLCSKIIANSESTRTWVTGADRRLAPRTVVIYNGVEWPQREPAAVRLGEPGRRHLVVAGRISQRKGQDVALKALHNLRARGYDVDLTIVGSIYEGYEEYRISLDVLIEALGLNDYVTLTGFRDDVPAYFRAADVVMVPSRVEPFGNVAVEAQMAGKPVVASDVQGLAEIVIDGETGLLVPPGGPTVLAAAVTRLLDDPGLATVLARQGQERARKVFDPSRYGLALVEAVL